MNVSLIRARTSNMEHNDACEVGTVPTANTTEVYSNGVKVIWRFYKPQDQEAKEQRSTFGSSSKNSTPIKSKRVSSSHSRSKRKDSLPQNRYRAQNAYTIGNESNRKVSAMHHDYSSNAKYSRADSYFKDRTSDPRPYSLDNGSKYQAAVMPKGRNVSADYLSKDTYPQSKDLAQNAYTTSNEDYRQDSAMPNDHIARSVYARYSYEQHAGNAHNVAPLGSDSQGRGFNHMQFSSGASVSNSGSAQYHKGDMRSSFNGEILEGLIERVTYHNEENGFCVLRLNVPGEYDLITMVGHASSVTPGEYVSAQGQWIINKEFGRQFQADKLQVYPPNTLEGIERYLGSGMVKGIGPKLAGTLVSAFGEQIFDVIEQHPEKMLELHGIGQKRVNLITSGWADQKVIRSIMVFLQSHGVSTSKAVRIFKLYGNKAIDLVSENPYRLAKDIRGIGFKSADTIARNIGIGEFSPLRARAGVAYALSQASSNDGHCCLPRPELIKLAQDLLNMPEEIINDAIAYEVHEGNLIVSNEPVEDCIFLASLFRAEKRIASSIKELLSEARPWPVINETKAIEWVEHKLSIYLAQSQKQAVKQALNSKVMVITGGPGVGKTTIVKAILTILAAKNINIKLCAPTGRAAKRLSESSGYEATTIHRLLEIDPSTMEFKYNEDNPLNCDLLVIDECSMVDIPLANNLLKAVPSHAAVIFVGDVDQLPSVGPGAFLGDLIKSQVVSVIYLKEVFRQAASSWIVRIAHQINSGQLPTFPTKNDNGDCYFVSEDNRENLTATLVNLVQQRLPKAYGVNPISDIQVLCPMNRGDSGARVLNLELKKVLNPATNNSSITKAGYTFSVGDKVMQIENNYDREVYNGDVGFITHIDQQEEVLTVNFDGHIAVYPFSELDELTLSYACTIHKSQGSEYPIVVIPLTMQHFMMLKRNLVYTGVTRGKKLVVLVGEKKALTMAVRDWRTKERYSGLKEQIQKALSK